MVSRWPSMASPRGSVFIIQVITQKLWEDDWEKMMKCMAKTPQEIAKFSLRLSSNETVPMGSVISSGSDSPGHQTSVFCLQRKIKAI